MVDQRESRSLLSVGIAWASRITTLALDVRGAGRRGLWPGSVVADKSALHVVGAVLGFVLFMVRTLRMAKELATEDDRKAAAAASAT